MAAEMLPDDLALPFHEFVTRTCEWLQEEEDLRDDEVMFHFVRALKAHSHTRAMGAESAYRAVLGLARKRIEVVLPNTDFESEDSVVAFYSMWERVRFPMGTDPVQYACAMAPQGLIKTQSNHPGRYERFLTVAALIQIQMRQQPIYLPVRKVGEHFGCEPNTINCWVRWAVLDGALIKTKEHVFRSQGQSFAAEYVFGLHCWDQTAHAKLGALMSLPVRPVDVKWTREQFEASGRSAM
jgi:hypothetical protein